MKKLVSLLTVAVMLVLAVPNVGYAANNTTWTKVAWNEWNYQNPEEGTNLTAKFVDNVLYIDGTGAIPSYTMDCLGNRPWNDCNIFYLEIGSQVTSIGANAFFNFPNLMTVKMFAGTFIEDVSAFKSVHEDCYFYIKGMNIVSRNIGSIPYTSLDSIAAFMAHYNGIYRYQLENYYMIGMVQNNTSAKIKDIAPATASTETNANYPLINYKSQISYTGNIGKNTHAVIEGRRQGVAAYEAINFLMGDYSFVNTYNISVYNTYGILAKTDMAATYTMTIPNAYKFPGRVFQLIQIANGACNILSDIDADESTVSFTTDTPTGVYALVYKDTFMGVQ